MSEKLLKQKKITKVKIFPTVCRDSQGRVMFSISATQGANLELWSVKKYKKIKIPKHKKDFYDGDEYTKVPIGEDITLHGEVPVTVTNNDRRVFHWRFIIEFFDANNTVFYQSHQHIFFHSPGTQNTSLHSKDPVNSKDTIDFSRIKGVKVRFAGPYQGARDFTKIVFP